MELGEPVGSDQPTSKNIQFRIYTAEQGGEVKYAEEQTVTVDKGYFSVLLGQGTAIPGEPGPPTTLFSKVFEGNKSFQRFIGIRVDGTDINPRLRYVASPYSVLSQRSIQAGHSQTVESISGHKADSAVQADNATMATAVESISGHKADTAGRASAAVADTVAAGFVPVNGIIMWTKSSIPDGWRICDGGGGTPNLVNRFCCWSWKLVWIGRNWGSNTVSLTWNQMPKHSHSGGVHAGGTIGIIFIQGRMTGMTLEDGGLVGVMVIMVIIEGGIVLIGVAIILMGCGLIIRAVLIVMKIDLLIMP